MIDLRCQACDRTYPDGPNTPWRCECGHALDFARSPDPDGSPPGPDAVDTRQGMWTFADLLPVPKRVSLGAGMTPLLDVEPWNVEFKLEYIAPTGSFKDRGAATTISRAVAHGIERVFEDSSGNAGQAIATYAARAGIAAEIYVPADASSKKREAIERTGATIHTVEGSRSAATEACQDAVEEEGGWYASHAWDPAFYAGTSTTAFEIALQRDWSAPDSVVVPTGHGTLALGLYRGFRTLSKAGWIDSVPRLLLGQAAGHAPVVAAWDGARAATGSNTLASGIQIDRPARLDQLLDALEATNGAAVAIDEHSVKETLDTLHTHGFYTEPTCAVAPAAVEAFRSRGTLEPDADVVVPLTGHGFNT